VGHWEFEAGEFTLPYAEFAKVRKAVELADKAMKEKAFLHTQTFWKGLTARQKTNINEYAKAQDAFVTGLRSTDTETRDLAEHLTGAYRMQGKPRRVLPADMDYPTNRTLSFGSGEFGMSFNKETNSVDYSTAQNRHVIEAAHSTGIYGALMKSINGMRWTRNTGGRIWNDNEYADESRREQGYASDLTSYACGPIGAQSWPSHTAPWKDPTGATFHAETKVGRFGIEGRVKKGVPAGGQFTGRNRSESTVFLSPWR
jgi:hypothetical protein